MAPMSDQDTGSRAWLLDGAMYSMYSKNKGKYAGVHRLVYTLDSLSLSNERS